MPDPGRGGLRLPPAFSGSEAMLWAERYDYDLVLLDLMLPGLSGEEFIAQLRRKKTMPILVLSCQGGAGGPCKRAPAGRRRLSSQTL